MIPRRWKRVDTKEPQQSTLMSVADWAFDSLELVWGPEPPPPYGETVSLRRCCMHLPGSVWFVWVNRCAERGSGYASEALVSLWYPLLGAYRHLPILPNHTHSFMLHPRSPATRVSIYPPVAMDAQSACLEHPAGLKLHVYREPASVWTSGPRPTERRRDYCAQTRTSNNNVNTVLVVVVRQPRLRLHYNI